MKKTFFTVGPSQLFPTVSTHLKNAVDDNIMSISHRSEEFKRIYQETDHALRHLLAIPETHHIFFLSSAQEAMERILMNTVQKYSYHFVNGAFSKKFYTEALAQNKNPEKYEIKGGELFDFNLDIPNTTEVICLTQNETSCGASISMPQIYSLKTRYPKTLIAIDIVSSVPYCNIDFSKIDMTFFSVQKGMGLPAGLGVLIVNEAGLEKAEWIKKHKGMIGGYRSFPSLLENEQKYQTAETPNVLGIYLLGKVAKDLMSIGVDTLRQNTEEKAKLIYDFFDNHTTYRPFINGSNRSMTTIVIDANGQAMQTVARLAEQGIIIGKGYGNQKDNQIRIANFPTHSLQQVKDLLKHF